MGSSHECSCRKQTGDRAQPLGLDELMIVNPAPLHSGALFLGADGTLYQVQGSDEGEELHGLGEFFMGEDGSLYRIEGLSRHRPARLGDEHMQAEHYFLGADGTVYAVETL